MYACDAQEDLKNKNKYIPVKEATPMFISFVDYYTVCIFYPAIECSGINVFGQVAFTAGNGPQSSGTIMIRELFGGYVITI